MEKQYSYESNLNANKIVLEMINYNRGSNYNTSYIVYNLALDKLEKLHVIHYKGEYKLHISDLDNNNNNNLPVKVSGIEGVKAFMQANDFLED